MPTYATVADFKTAVGKTTSTNDTQITLALDASEQLINTYMNRPDGFIADASATAKEYNPRDSAYVEIDDCIAVSTVEYKQSVTDPDSDYVTLASTYYKAVSGTPSRPDFNTLPYSFLLLSWDSDRFVSGKLWGNDRDKIRYFPTVRVTAKWGYAEEVPDIIKYVTIAQAARWYKRMVSFFDMSMANVNPFGEMQFTSSIDSDLKFMLNMSGLRKYV